MTPAPQPIKAPHVLMACARKFDWRKNLMMPEYEIDGGRADLLMVTPSGFACEIEIKITRSDWNADQGKRKFQGARPQISRFYYAGPMALMEQPPEWLPEDVGLIGCNFDSYGSPRARMIKKAKRRPATKMPPEFWSKAYLACYFRFWALNARTLAQAVGNV